MMYMKLLSTLLLVAGMRVMRPEGGDVDEIASAIVSLDATPLEKEWLAAIAFRESSFVADAVGDHGSSWCFAQVHLPAGAKTRDGWTGPELAADPSKCARAALRTLRVSMSRCAWLPPEERIALYARGRCESRIGQRLSRDRNWVRLRMFGGG